MENKKLLKFLLLNLSELEELVADKNTASFNDFEMEFLQNRLKESKKLAKLLMEKEQQRVSPSVRPEKNQKKENPSENISLENTVEKEIPKIEDLVENKTEEPVQPKQETAADIEIQESQGIQIQEEPENRIHEKQPEPKEVVAAEIKTEEPETKGETKGELEDVEEEEIKDKRLGDSFVKEKSVNDLMHADLKNLEFKLSNRPVTSIQAAIGINDKFQYIRELFDGNAESFRQTVSDLDKMNDISEAVKYLQSNFSWKKNETSLKFVQLVKRRFPNE